MILLQLFQVLLDYEQHNKLSDVGTTVTVWHATHSEPANSAGERHNPKNLLEPWGGWIALLTTAHRLRDVWNRRSKIGAWPSLSAIR